MPRQWESWIIALRTAIVKTAIVTQIRGRRDERNRLVHARRRSRPGLMPDPDDS